MIRGVKFVDVKNYREPAWGLGWTEEKPTREKGLESNHQDLEH
jgi:hypothetical protein